MIYLPVSPQHRVEYGIDESFIRGQPQLLVTFEYFTMKRRFDFHTILLHQLSGCLIIALALDALYFGKQLCEKLAKLWVIGDTYVCFSVALLKTDCIAFLITPPGYECPVAHVSLFYLLSGLDTDELRKQSVEHITVILGFISLIIGKKSEFYQFLVGYIIKSEQVGACFFYSTAVSLECIGICMG